MKFFQHLNIISPFDFQDLMEQLEKQDKTVRKLKKQLKVFAKKIGELEGICYFVCVRGKRCLLPAELELSWHHICLVPILCVHCIK